MPNTLTTTPVVMSISSHAPCGGAGISADIATLNSLGCHCTPIITKLSARDTTSLKDIQITDTGLLIGQIRAVLEDIPVNLFKLGDLGSIENAEAIHTILNDYPEIPIVLDPVLPSKNTDFGLTHILRNQFLASAHITVLNEAEAHQLAPGADTLSACVQELLEFGCDHLLITGMHGSSSTVQNHLYTHRGLSNQYEWERLPNTYHGAGSTLSAALSAYLSHGLSLAESVQQAQQFTWQALQKGIRIGMGKLLPDRMHWCKD
jgi:hydroxymethylpyrimidine/phosphomethylpyrimidine kinase